jgi:branched-chain amino acid transport system substrate-binding protein
MGNKTLALILFLFVAAPAWPQASKPQKAQEQPATEERYANMPEDAVPFRHFSKAYQEWFIEPNTLEYNGAAEDRRDGDINKLSEVAIGFFGPIENNPESLFGIPALHGAQLAVEEANARGGYKGKPYALKVHNESALWGASSGELVKMLFNENCWAMVGCIDGQNCHISLRVALKLEVPIIDTGTTDRTVTETRIQWLLHNFPDDRVQGYALADYIFKDLHLKRIGDIRTNSRYARIGIGVFNDTARRMQHQPILEVKFDRGDKDFSRQLRMLRDAKVDGVVIWSEAPEAALILKQMRAMGMKQPVFGSSRTAYPQLLEIAGPAAEGYVATTAMDPTRQDPKWLAFREKFRQRFGEEPDPYAAHAYDGINILIGAIEKTGLNRGRIMKVLRDYQLKTYDGASGVAYFDRALNNIAGVTMTKVENGKFTYWKAHTSKPEEPVVAQGR